MCQCGPQLDNVQVSPKRWTIALWVFLFSSVVVGLFPTYARAEEDHPTDAFSESDGSEEDLGEEDAELLLEQQRNSLNRPFSITPSDMPSGDEAADSADDVEPKEIRSQDVSPSAGQDILPVLPVIPPADPNLPQSTLPAPEKDAFLSRSPSSSVGQMPVVSISPNTELNTENVLVIGTTTAGSPVTPDSMATGPTAGLRHPPLLFTSVQTLENLATETLDTRYNVPIVYNEHVEAYINLFQTRLRDRFEVWLARSGQYVPMIQKILKKNDLPEDLAFLPLIESGFNPKAYSSAKAVGPWQFMSPTGKQYGLLVNKWIDERRDPVKSTVAAASYLKNLYGMFQSWALSLASYNAGEGRISRAMAKTQAEDFWELKESDHIHDETKNYVPKFMAATIIAKDPEKYGFFIDYHAPLVYDEVGVPTATSLKVIARAAGVSVEKIKFYNPELKLDTTPPNYPGYRLKIPPGTRETVAANLASKKKVKMAKKKSGNLLSSSKKPKVKIHKKKTASKRQIASAMPRKKRD